MIRPGSEVDTAINLIVDTVFSGVAPPDGVRELVDPYHGEHMVALGARTALRAAGMTTVPRQGEKNYGPWYGVEPYSREIR